MKKITGAELEQLIKPGTDQVFVLTCPATLPFAFGRHPWFVVNRQGTVSRWEVFWRPAKSWPARWGFIHKDFYEPAEGIAKYFFTEKYLWEKKSIVIGMVEGDLARRIADVIEATPRVYPYRDRYSLSGPNSNTYVAWVLRQFPESGIALAWNSFGKSFS